jgi:DNA repair photolyase
MAKKKFVSGTGEWATHVVNIQVGCSNDCSYGYCKSSAIRWAKCTAEEWKNPVINQKLVNKKRSKLEGTVMYPSQHDILPSNINESITVLKNLLTAGNRVLIVSKPHLECVEKMCDELAPWKSQILFRFTIGSANDEILKRWEPGAPNFKERVKSLIYAFESGFETSVSCEPMLDKHISKVVDATSNYVTDAIWLGKPNKIVARVKMNNPGDDHWEALAKDLEALFDDDYIWRLYGMYKDNSKIRWKDSIKEVVGLDRATEKGLDK